MNAPCERGPLRRCLRGELPRFGLVGVASNVVYFGVLSFGSRVLGAELWAVAAVSYVTSMSVNYLLQRNLTFRSDRLHSEALVRYLVVQGVAMALNSLLLHVVVTSVGMAFWIGQGSALSVTTAWNYLAQRYWVFAASPMSETNAGA